MSLLKNPSEINETVLVKGLIYGQPGIGKSTVALSAPNPVMIDADMGMHRVEKRHQVASLPLESYASLLQLLNSNELDGYQTLVFDTLGKLVDRMADYVMSARDKARQGDGSLSMKGWGYLKLEFQKLLKLAESKNKHLIFVAHEKEDRSGDTRIVRPDVSGSAGKDLLKELDFMGYMEMLQNERTISFTPCEKFYAKNSLKLPPVIRVPSTDDHSNNFIERVIVDRTIERLKEDEKTSLEYKALIEDYSQKIEQLDTVETVNDMLSKLVEDHSDVMIWDAQPILKRELSKKASALGFGYNKETRAFEQKEEVAA